MSPTGPQYPGTVVSASGSNGAWTNPTNAEVSDAVYASGNISSGGSSTNSLNSTNYGFNLPPTAIIDGIYVEFQRYGSNAETGSVQIIKGGSLAGTSKTGTDTWPVSTEAWTGYGGATDLWGTTWLYSDINASNFGFGLIAQNTHGGGTAFVDAVRITVYWHTAPTKVAPRYIYQVFSNNSYIGDIPNVTSKYAHSHEINTGGTSIQVQCAISPDTSSLPVTGEYTDESGNFVTDENGNIFTTEGTSPIFSLGKSTLGALIKNGNEVRVYEISYYHPNGKLMFNGQIQRVDANYGSGSNTDTITMTIYSDGQDLNNYIIRANPYTYTLDQSQTTGSSTDTLSFYNGKLYSWNFDGQSFVIGAGVNELDAIAVELNGSADVTISVFSDTLATTLLGSTTQSISVGTPTVIQFDFPTPIIVTPGNTYLFTVTVAAQQTIAITYSNAAPYGSGSMYNNTYSGGSGSGSWVIEPANDLYFETYTGTGSTTGTFTDLDPTTGIVETFMNDYLIRGGLIDYTSSSVQATGLSLDYQFNTNTTFEGLNAMLTLCPNGFYYYVDLGTDTLYFKQANTVADIVLTQGKHIENLNFIFSIEAAKNQSYFSGGIVSGSNIYVLYQDPVSVALYGPKLDRLSDNHVTDISTATAIAQANTLANKNEQNQSTVTVLAKTMDITLFKPGMIIGFNGFGTFVEGILVQIVRIDYTPEQVTLTLGSLPKRLVPSLSAITKGLLAQETIDNPATPS